MSSSKMDVFGIMLGEMLCLVRIHLMLRSFLYCTNASHYNVKLLPHQLHQVL